MIPSITFQQSLGPQDGPMLVLGASLGTSTAVWSEASAALSSRFRVVCWELPGHGRSVPATASFTVGELADAVAEAVVEAGERSVLYAGVSLGGAVGLELALRHPSRVEALSVICSGAKIATPDLWRDRATSIRIAGTASLAGPSAGRWFAPNSLARMPEVTSALLTSLADVDDESYALCCEALATYDVRDDLSQLALAVQVMWGEFDSVAPEADARYLAARVGGADLVEVHDAGHLAPAEKPDEVVRLLENFFTRTAVTA